MSTKISGSKYAAMYGPTTGDKVRLADTSLVIEVEKDYTTYGDEVKFGALFRRKSPRGTGGSSANAGEAGPPAAHPPGNSQIRQRRVCAGAQLSQGPGIPEHGP